MAELLTDLKTVKLTTDPSGTVWCLEGFKLPKSTGQAVEQFVGSRPYAEPAHLRVPGLARNARLLVALHLACKQGEFAGLEVCSPMCCASAEHRNDPQLLLYSARGFNVPTSVGGWHHFDDGDMYSYLLAERYHAGVGDPATAHFELMSHPAWPALSFVGHLNAQAAAALLGLVVDPRWYLDPVYPDQGNKLPQFLGLDPKTQAAERPDKSGRFDRNRLVLSCWKTTDPPHPGKLSPSQFLWKTWYAKGGGTKGDLAASKRFVEFLRQTWLAAVCRDGHARRLFVPAFFFADDGEAAEAYARHVG